MVVSGTSSVFEPSPRAVNRHPKQTLHHAWAPKLGRTVLFTSREQLHLWVMLEAHPECPCIANARSPVTEGPILRRTFGLD